MSNEYKCKNTTIVAQLNELFKLGESPSAARSLVNNLSPEDVIDVWCGATDAGPLSTDELVKAKWMHLALANEVVAAFMYKQPETK